MLRYSNFGKKAVTVMSALALTAGLAIPSVVAEEAEAKTEVKNVIILIPDGMSVGATTLTRWYQGGQPLALDEMASGLVRTYSADAPIADSAPGGTALATGHKSHTGYVGVLPDENTMPGLAPLAKEDQRKPIASVLEAARLAGKSTGIIATSEFMHATPADFTAHYPDRSNYDALSEQQVYAGLDVVLGSGYKYLQSDVRKDKEDLIGVLKTRGYEYVTTPAAMRASDADKLWGLFAPTAMSYEMDRNPEEQPSIAEMTSKAIDVLSRNDEGFFLMVEGSKIDWAAHANDPIGIISDVAAFDDAVEVALNYAKQHKDTVVVSVTDHGNGGITIGNSDTTRTYDKMPLSYFIDPLKKAKLTGEGIAAKLNEQRSNVREVMEQYFGIKDLTDEEVEAIIATPAGSMNYTVGPMISKRAGIGWTSGGHTGEDVVLYTWSPDGDTLKGVNENTDIARYMARKLGVDLDAASKELFVLARDAFQQKGAEVEWNAEDVNNPVIVVTKGDDKLELPVFKSIAILNGKEIQLDGVVVFNGVKTYVPQSAIDLLP